MHLQACILCFLYYYYYILQLKPSKVDSETLYSHETIFYTSSFINIYI